MTGRDAGKGRVNRDDAEGKEGRDSMSKEGRELFLVAEDPRNLWFGAGVLAGFPARFLVFSAPSATREAAVVAHTKRAGRVGAGDSSEQARGGNGAGCDSRRWPGRSQTMIVVAEVPSSFRASIPGQAPLRGIHDASGMQRVVLCPPPLFASFTEKKKKSHRSNFLHPWRSQAGRIAKKIHCYIMPCDSIGQFGPRDTQIQRHLK